MNLEDQLKQALRAEAPPVGFAARVLRRTQESRRWQPAWRSPLALALAAGLVAAVAIPSVVFEHRHREQERALEARGQLMTALGITRIQIREVKEKIRRSTPAL